jgi:hypothetical protein
MLPPFIIDQIRKREDDDRHRREQPTLPLPDPIRREQKPADADEGQRGVVIIDLGAE